MPAPFDFLAFDVGGFDDAAFLADSAVPGVSPDTSPAAFDVGGFDGGTFLDLPVVETSTIEEAAIARILVIGAVSSAVGTHVYADKRPATLGGVLPAIEVSVPEFDPDEVLDGPSGTIEVHVIFRVLAATVKEAERIVLAIKALSGTSGTWGDLAVDYAIAAGEKDGYLVATAGNDPAHYIDLVFRLGFQQ